MKTELLYALFAYAFIASITPGPNNLMLMASGANFGLKRTLPHMLGVSCGFVLMLILVGLGLMQIFEAVPITFSVLKVVSSIYLLYLAWKIANASPMNASTEKASDASKPFTFIQACLFQWVNPKAWTMALTAISAYTVQEKPYLSLFFIAGFFWIANFPAITIWALVGTKIKQFLNSPLKARIFNVTAAITLAATLYPVWFEH